MSPPYNLTDEEEKLAQHQMNRYYTWVALGRPDRVVTAEEARHHYATNTQRYRLYIFSVNDGEQRAKATLG